MKTKQFVRFFGIFSFSFLCLGQVQQVHNNDTCVWQQFEASCDPGKVIVIEAALFGRMYRTGCFDLSKGETPCSDDVQLLLEKLCAGRRSCKIRLTTENFKSVNGSCDKHKERFLHTTHRCEDVYSADDENCTVNQSLIVRSTSGYLASVVTDETGKGSALCPWRFEPKTGQTVHLTLLDFGVWEDRAERERRDICRIYATVMQVALFQRMPPTLICAGNERERSIMTATTDLEILMTKQNSASTDIVYFLIKFQVFNCPDYETPPGAGLEKSETGIRVFCNDNRQVFSDLRCEAGRWMPQLNLTCTTSTASLSTTAASSFSSSCSDFDRPADASSFQWTGNQSIHVICFNGGSFDVSCVDGRWTSQLMRNCASPATESQSISLDKLLPYAVSGGILLLAVVVVIIAVVMYRSRRRDKNDKISQMISQSTDNNSYHTGRLFLNNSRPMSDIYDTLDESVIQDTCSSSNPSCVAGPRNCMTLPRNDPWVGCSLERRGDTLPVNRRLPEPHEYTTTLVRDSTYLVPKEELCDPHTYDTVPSKGNIEIDKLFDQ